jgi:hypothetical protein
MLTRQEPYSLPSEAEGLGQLRATCWTSAASDKSARRLSVVLFAVGGVAIVVGATIWLAMQMTAVGLCVAGAGVLITLFGLAGLADALRAPPHIIGVYKGGLAEARASGIRYSVPWSDLRHVKYQEFYPHRFAEKQILVAIEMPDRKKIRFKSTHQGDSESVLKLIRESCEVEYETWEQVLERTG